ncbi:hypothetical protein [Priestia sp. SB1]|uniref:hypothetical protein n=1 Tax=Priestia sp. SB1 TaxID=3132359 RepID=UPI00319E0218
MKNASSYNGWDLTFALSSVVFGATLAVSLLVLSINHLSAEADIKKYEVLKMTIDQSREDGNSEIERAALVKKIISFNTDLAETKYWNETVFDIFVPDKVAELDYLK